MDSFDSAFTLKQILLSISDSLNEAQNELKKAKPYDEFGRPNTMYTLPYLDFNLQVVAQFDEIDTKEVSTTITSKTNNTDSRRETTSDTKSMQQTKEKFASRKEEEQVREVDKSMLDSSDKIKSPSVIPNKTRLLKFSANTESNNSKKHNKIISTISGRFIAVAPNEGLPHLLLSVSSKSISVQNPNIRELRVDVINSSGEQISGALVEFNYSKDETEQLNLGLQLSHNSKFIQDTEVRTDLSGMATTQVILDSTDVKLGAILIFKVNVGNMFKKISI